MEPNATKFYLMTGGFGSSPPDPQDLVVYFNGIFNKPLNMKEVTSTLIPQGGGCAMIVDNDKPTAIIMAAYAKKAGVIVPNDYVFFDPVKALEAYRKINPDVVITDYDMPGMTGLEMVKRMRTLR